MKRSYFVLTPEASKRLIARGVVQYEPVKRALKEATVVVVAGSTNGYVAQLLVGEEFPRGDFLRGYLGPHFERGKFPGDVILTKGVYQQGGEIFDVADQLGPYDVVLKGANALNYARREAAVLVAHPAGGTVLQALRAVYGRRTRLVVPVGLEKAVNADLWELSRYAAMPGAEGWRLVALPGEVFTEIEALSVLTGVQARHLASGGIAGGEGSVVLVAEGPEQELKKAGSIVRAAGGTVAT